jgi:hypothetical protein
MTMRVILAAIAGIAMGNALGIAIFLLVIDPSNSFPCAGISPDRQSQYGESARTLNCLRPSARSQFHLIMGAN